MNHQLTHWTSYVFTGLLAMVMSWALTGCRLGNHIVENQKDICDIFPIGDGVSGCYSTQPQSLKWCTTLVDANGLTGQSCTAGSIDRMPADLKVLTDPVVLYLDDPDTGQASLRSHENTDTGIPSFVTWDTEKGYLLDYDVAFDPMVLWDDPSCLTQVNLSEDGNVSVTSNSGILGQLAVTIKKTISISGQTDHGCDATLATLESCYSNPAACGGANGDENDELSQAVRDFFSPFIEAGALTAAQIHQVRALEYIADYQ